MLHFGVYVLIFSKLFADSTKFTYNYVLYNLKILFIWNPCLFRHNFSSVIGQKKKQKDDGMSSIFGSFIFLNISFKYDENETLTS